MMICQICGDTQGPWEYELYTKQVCMTCKEDKKCKDCIHKDILLVCEDCAKVLRKKRKNRRKEKWYNLFMR